MAAVAKKKAARKKPPAATKAAANKKPAPRKKAAGKKHPGSETADFEAVAADLDAALERLEKLVSKVR